MDLFVRSAGVLALVGAMAVSAGCGGDDKQTQETKPSISQIAPAEKKKQAAATQKELGGCLSRQGVKKVPPGNKKLSKKEKLAVQRCGLALLGGAVPTSPSQIDALRACLRKRGVILPTADQMFVPNVQDPKVAAALKACQAETTKN